MSRRLLNRGRASAASSSSTPAPSSDLPDYEAPSCLLDDSGRRALGELSNNRGTATYEQQLKETVRFLGTSVGDLQERLRERRERLDRVKRRRQEKGTDKTAEEQRLEAHIPQLEAQVEALSRDSESAMRGVIDKRAELEDEAAVLGDVYTTASTTAPNNNQAEPTNSTDETEAEHKPDTSVPSTLQTFRDMRTAKQTDYDRLTLHQRYGLNNDYAGFKKLWHDAAAGEDEAPLPDASRWFRSNGQPVLNHVGGGGRGGSVDDEAAGSDDDIAVAREVLSLNCPLTLRPMDEPYSNAGCKHTFEKSAILEYLTPRGEGQCPQTGCWQVFFLSSFDQDFYLNHAMLRRIQRSKQTQRLHSEMDDVDDEDGSVGNGEADESLVMGAEMSLRGRNPKREPR